jgi:osmotically inducible protein OsmC
MREQQIVPLLLHDPWTARQRPRAMRRVLKNFHHQDPSNPLLDILLRSIYPSSIAQNRISSINVISYYAKKRKEAFMDRKASAVWTGGLKDGKGTLSTDSGVLKQAQYSFSTRFENGIGTNPEELLAAAHAGCFTMALSAQLGNAGMTAQKLETTATITLAKVGEGFSVTKSHLDLVANIPGADKAKFDAAVKAAETGCPVSKLFKAEITVNARLQS